MTNHVDIFAARALVNSLREEEGEFLKLVFMNPDLIKACLEQIEFNTPSIAVERSPMDLKALFSVKYALGRMTTSSSYVSEFIQKNWNDLGVETKDEVKQLIKRALEYGQAGAPADAALWESILALPDAPAMKV